MNELKIIFVSEIFHADINHYKMDTMGSGFLVGTHCHSPQSVSDFFFFREKDWHLFQFFLLDALKFQITGKNYDSELKKKQKTNQPKNNRTTARYLFSRKISVPTP